MILFDSIYDTIILELATDRSLSIQELHTRVTKVIPISLPNFYKVISRLITNQILIKENGKISIHKRWIMGMWELVERLKESYQNSDESTILNLNDWQFLEYFWGSILEIDWLWWNLMIALNKHYWRETETFVYQAHPYYMLWTRETEIDFFEQESTLSKIHFLTWNTSFLDMHWIGFYEKIGIDSHATENVSFPREWYCVTVIWDYIFEFIYPTHISEYFKLLFETTSSIKSYNPELFRKIFEIRTRCKLTVRKNKKLAEDIRDKFLINII